MILQNVKFSIRIILLFVTVLTFSQVKVRINNMYYNTGGAISYGTPIVLSKDITTINFSIELNKPRRQATSGYIRFYYKKKIFTYF